MSSTTAEAADRGRLAGTLALITGASRGIGLECARVLYAEGMTVLLLGRDVDALRDATEALGQRASYKRVDFAADVERTAAELRRDLKGVPYILVNNAAEFFITPAEDTRVEDFDRVLRVNLTAHFAIVREFLGDMKKRGSGHIVTIGSIADERGLPGNAAYSASKFGLRGLHEVLREELRGTGIRATLISPARVDTSIWSSPGAGKARGPSPSPAGMIPAAAIGAAVRYAVTQPPEVNVDELRLSRS
jgi:NAD(P)-dependent dehydrogenase (short-subunit alcohol dehydrogenase family)